MLGTAPVTANFVSGSNIKPFVNYTHVIRLRQKLRRSFRRMKWRSKERKTKHARKQAARRDL